MMNLGDFSTADTIYVPIATYDPSTGASITLTGLATTDIEIYKNGSTTQRASDSGYTLLDTDGIDFDGVTGLHGFSVDLSDNADAGFYANGGQYWLVVNAVTIDAQTVVLVYYFTIGYSLSTTAAVNATLAWDGTGGVPLKLSQFWVHSTGNDNAIDVAGSGSGHAAQYVGGATGCGTVRAGGATSGHGEWVFALKDGDGINIACKGNNNAAIRGTAVADAGDDDGQGLILRGLNLGAAIDIKGGDDAHAFLGEGGANGGDAFYLIGGTAGGHGLSAWGTVDHTAILGTGHGTGDGMGLVGGTDASTPGDGLSCYSPGNVAAPGGGAGISASSVYGYGFVTVVTQSTAAAAFGALCATGNVPAVLLTSSGTGVDLKMTGTTSLSVGTKYEIADTVWARDWASVTSPAARSGLQALRPLLNKTSISGTTLSVYKEDDTTVARTSTLTTSASANIVTGVTPD